MDPAGLSSLCVNKRLLDVMDPAGLSSLCNNVVHAVSKIFCNGCHHWSTSASVQFVLRCCPAGCARPRGSSLTEAALPGWGNEPMVVSGKRMGQGANDGFKPALHFCFRKVGEAAARTSQVLKGLGASGQEGESCALRPSVSSNWTWVIANTKVRSHCCICVCMALPRLLLFGMRVAAGFGDPCLCGSLPQRTGRGVMAVGHANRARRLCNHLRPSRMTGLTPFQHLSWSTQTPRAARSS